MPSGWTTRASTPLPGGENGGKASITIPDLKLRSSEPAGAATADEAAPRGIRVARLAAAVAVSRKSAVGTAPPVSPLRGAGPPAPRNPDADIAADDDRRGRCW